LSLFLQSFLPNPSHFCAGVGAAEGTSDGDAEGDFVGLPLVPVGSPVAQFDGVGPKLEIGGVGAPVGGLVGP